VSNVSTFGTDLIDLYANLRIRIQRRARVTPHSIFYQKEGGQKGAKKAVSKLLIYIFYICFNGAVEKSSTPNPCTELPLTL